MMKEAIGTGNSVEAAIQDACQQLGVSPETVETEILKEPSAKTLGIFGGSPAQVKVIYNQSTAGSAEDFLKDVLTKMGAGSFTVSSEETDGGIIFNIDGDDLGFVIGHRGEALDSLQYLVSLVANKGKRDYYRVTLNSGSYREKREQTLISLAQKISAQSLKTGRINHLEPMNPYERRIIHSAVGEIEGISSWSVGDYADRHVVIGPKHKEGQTGGAPGGRYGSSRGGRDNRDSRDRNRSRDGENKAPVRRDRDRTVDRGEGFKAPPKRENKPFVSRTNISETTTAREPLKDFEDQPLYGKIDVE